MSAHRGQGTGDKGRGLNALERIASALEDLAQQHDDTTLSLEQQVCFQELLAALAVPQAIIHDPVLSRNILDAHTRWRLSFKGSPADGPEPGPAPSKTTTSGSPAGPVFSDESSSDSIEVRNLAFSDETLARLTAAHIATIGHLRSLYAIELGRRGLGSRHIDEIREVLARLAFTLRGEERQESGQ